MKLSIKSLLFGCLAAAMLVPPLKLGGVEIFDLFVYGVLALCVLRRLYTHGFSISAFSRVEKLLIAFVCLTLVTYAVRLTDFDQQMPFLRQVGTTIDFLFLRLSLYGLLTVLLLGGIFHLAAHRLTSTDDIRRAVSVIVVCGTLNAVAALATWIYYTHGELGRYNFVPPLEDAQGPHIDRMALTFLLAFAAWTSGATTTRRQRVALLICMALTGLSIATVQVRLGWGTFALMLILFIAFSWKTLERKYRVGALTLLSMLILGAVLFFLSSSSKIFQQLLTPAQNTNTEGDVAMRVELGLQGLSVFRDHLIVGVGYGHYAAYSTVPVLLRGRWDFESSPHNGLIGIAAETGILGLICVAWLCFSLVSLCYRARGQAQDPITRALVNVVFSLVLVLLPLQLIANSLILPPPVERSIVQYVFLYWFFFGLTAATLRIKPHSAGVLPNVE